MQVLSLGREDPLEAGTATPSSILAWRVPWTEEPGGRSQKSQTRLSDFHVQAVREAPIKDELNLKTLLKHKEIFHHK